LQLSTCSGCSVSILNSTNPDIKTILLDELISNKFLSLKYHVTIMAGTGEQVTGILEKCTEGEIKDYVLVVEGSIPTKDNGHYGTIGEKDGKETPMIQTLENTAKNSFAIIALGTCSSYGGIPAGAPNPTGCVSLKDFLEIKKINKPFVNVPGCPPHPDWFTGTIAHILLKGLPSKESLDDDGRLKTFYGNLIHENCPLRAYYDEGKFAKKFGDTGCLYELGCKGPVSYADCYKRLWNNGTNWCIGNGAPCQGCVQPEFPDTIAPLYEKLKDIDIKL
jgi:hydrogenase small subunit